MNQIISINWNDKKSIQKAELKKSRLENSGYNLINTQNLNQNITHLTYKKP